MSEVGGVEAFDRGIEREQGFSGDEDPVGAGRASIGDLPQVAHGVDGVK